MTAMALPFEENLGQKHKLENNTPRVSRSESVYMDEEEKHGYIPMQDYSNPLSPQISELPRGIQDVLKWLDDLGNAVDNCYATYQDIALIVGVCRRKTKS
eukprot:TRINITY_DN2055_c0_g1_i1.p2 TRINITY_DN2055_c0_g1~~TRINITY_DN2055_c0_g1_i1.p2  ORF type:complete len:100 (+),score=7.25 TRINITY_DN2055_c0_g1_i1:199-498(+)